MKRRKTKKGKKILRIMTIIILVMICVLGLLICLNKQKEIKRFEDNTISDNLKIKHISDVKLNEQYTQTPTEVPTYTPSHYKYEERTTYVKEKRLSCHAISNVYSSTNRNINMKIAGKIINGKGGKGYILMPGKTFSWLNVVGNTTPEKGFKTATVIINKQYVQDYGGGVCQVSSTLNSAVIKAGLRTKSLKHSLPSSYIGPNDYEATVSYASGKDLSFKNTFKFPIKIKVITKDGTVIVKVFKMKKKTKIIKVKMKMP